MGRHHTSKNGEQQWRAAVLTEGEARSAERTDHHEQAANRTESDKSGQKE